MVVNLTDFENDEHIKSLAEAIGHIYKGKIIQVYWSESGGNTKYSDYDVNSNMYIEGKVLWGRGDVFALEVTHATQAKTYTKQVVVNAWSINFIAEKDDLTLTCILKGALR